MQRRSMTGLKHSLEENGFALRACEFKSQINGIKVVHCLFNQKKHMKVLDRMNLGNSEIMGLPYDEQQRCWEKKDAVKVCVSSTAERRTLVTKLRVRDDDKIFLRKIPFPARPTPRRRKNCLPMGKHFFS